jgi:High potential iron-sulfur protein
MSFKCSFLYISDVDRRTLNKTFLLIAGAALLPARHSRAADLPHLDIKDPAAVAQGYVEDADRVDAKKYPAFVKGSTCDNCLLLQGKPGTAYRPCDLFPGKLVAAKGWCSGWSAEI